MSCNTATNTHIVITRLKNMGICKSDGYLEFIQLDPTEIFFKLKAWFNYIRTSQNAAYGYTISAEPPAVLKTFLSVVT